MQNEYNLTLVLLGNRFPIKSRSPDEKLVIKADPFQAKETGKLYVTPEGSRVKKDQILKLRKVSTDLLPLYEVYCFQGDEDKAADLIWQQLAKDLEVAKAHVDGIHASIQAGREVLDQDEIVRRLRNSLAAPVAESA